MKINDFNLELYFEKHEFTAKYMLSSSDCDGYSMKYILDNITEEEREMWEKLTLGYTESNGSSVLRNSISMYYKNTSADDIVVASPGELSFSLMNVLLEAGDHVIAPFPSYQSLYEVVRSIGCDISFWCPQDEDWSFDVEKLAKMVKKNTKLIIINFPHNPTGAYLTRKEIDRIIEIARDCGAYIYSDEMYRGLWIDCEPLPPLSDLYEKAVTLWGTSKSFGLAGIRTGWLVSQNKEILRKVLSFKDYLSICNSAPAELLTVFALNHPEKYIDKNVNKIKRNLAAFASFVMESPIFKEVVWPRAGSVSFVPINTNKSSLQFSDELVEKTGIMTVPAEMFDYPGKFLRIGFGRENFIDVLNILKNNN